MSLRRALIRPRTLRDPSALWVKPPGYSTWRIGHLPGAGMAAVGKAAGFSKS
jgi:hypothetical protein